MAFNYDPYFDPNGNTNFTNYENIAEAGIGYYFDYPFSGNSSGCLELWNKKVTNNQIVDDPFLIQFETSTKFYDQYEIKLKEYLRDHTVAHFDKFKDEVIDRVSIDLRPLHFTTRHIILYFDMEFTPADGSEVVTSRKHTVNLMDSVENNNNLPVREFDNITVPAQSTLFKNNPVGRVYKYTFTYKPKVVEAGTYKLTPKVGFLVAVDKSKGHYYYKGLYTLNPIICNTQQRTQFIMKDPKIVIPVPYVKLSGEPDTSYREMLNNEKFLRDIYLTVKNKDTHYSQVSVQQQKLKEDGTNDGGPINDTRLPKKFDSEGIYKITYYCKMKRSGFQVKATRTFTLDKGKAEKLDIFGISRYEEVDEADIYIEAPTKAKNKIIDVSIIRKDVTPNQRNTISLSGKVPVDYENEDDGEIIKCYNIKWTTPGTYDIEVTVQHTTSLHTVISRVKDWIVLEDEDEDEGDDDGSNLKGLIRFKNDYPQHSAYYYIVSKNPKYNKVTYDSTDNLNPHGDNEWFSSPILHFDNYKITAKDTRGSSSKKNYKSKSKQSNNVTHYEPEHPRIVDVTDGGVYNTERHIRFINVATKPDEAIYYIFLDGKLLSNPFNKTFDLFDDGYHFINILTMNKIRPWYYFEVKNCCFLIRNQSFLTIRKPKIILKESYRDEFTDVTVKFSDLNQDFKHTVTITYDNPINPTESYTYPYDIKEVNYKIYFNCTIIVKTELVENNIYATDSAEIKNNFTENPPIYDPSDVIEIFGPTDYEIDDDGVTKNISVGQYFIADIHKNVNVNYKAYLNGYPYELGSLVTNREPEIKKYTLEVYMINKWNENLVSYYTKEFIVDTIMLPYPMLMNFHPNIMNRLETRKDNDNIFNQQYILKENTINKNPNYTLNLDNLIGNGFNKNYLRELHKEYMPKDLILKAQKTYLPKFSTILNDSGAPITKENKSIESNLQSFIKDNFLLNRIVDIKSHLIPVDDEYILSVTYIFYNGCIRTNSFYFSVNDNEKRLLAPNKGILKAVDYKTAVQESNKEEKDGEFIVDRLTGHLWYNKEGVITPITKNYEDKILDVEEKLLAIEDEHIKFKHLYEFVSQYLEYLISKAEKFLNELRNKYEELLLIGEKLKELLEEIKSFEERLREFERLSHNNTATLDMKKDEIIRLTNKITPLNNEFENFVASLRSTFTKAAKVTYCAYNIKAEINRCVDLDEFEEFKEECEEKISNFRDWVYEQYLKNL